MPFYPKRRRYARKRRYVRKSTRKRVAKPSKTLKKQVQKIIHADVETKQAFHAVTAVSYNSGINAVGDVTRVVPSIGQGTGDNQRVGDQLKAQSLTIKGAIVYNPSIGQYGTYANARLGVRMMIVQPRQYSNLDDVQSNAGAWLTFLLKKGGTTVAFTGVLSDLWAPINSDAIIKYYDRVVYLDAPYQQTAVGSVTMGNSTRMFSHTLKLRNKTLKYDSNISGGLNATNYAPVFIIGYVHMDGSAPDVATTAIQLSYDTIFNYEDA